MSGFVQILLPVLFVSSVTAKEPYRWFALNQEIARYEKIAACVNSTARRLFDSGNRLAVICGKCGPLENEIARLLMKEKPVIMATKPLNFTNERTRSYVIVETKNATNLRKDFLGENRKFSRVFEYLIVLATKDEVVQNLSRDMWQFGYRYFAFLLFYDNDYGKIGLPGMDNNNEFALQVHKVCTTTNGKNSLTPFSGQFCLLEKCVLRYGGVTDETVNYWRNEDKLWVPGIGSKFIDEFGHLYNITIDASVSRQLNWSEATRLLNEDKVDIVTGWIPNNIEKYEGLRVLCWYRSRIMVFAARIRHRNVNEMLQLVMPFHYFVWICVACLLIFYLSLVYILKRFWDVGLISEYIRYSQICEIALAQGVNFPEKMGLRIVLGLWMVFSLYLNIIYDSTFTSSLAKIHDEILLTSLKELRNSNQLLGGPAIIGSYLNDTNDKIMNDLYERYQIMSSIDALEALFFKNAMIVVQLFTVDSLNWLNRANRTLRIYTLADPVLQFPLSFFTRKEHPYFRFFQLTVSRIRESGLWDKWYKSNLIDEDKRLTQETDEGILTMAHLRSVFELFLVCIAISFFIFVLELLYYYLLRIVRRLTRTSKVVSFASKKRDLPALDAA
ncbi:hypothetical protein KPH14_007712 [Odynerus spinipes]|uniref:Uncharacterized protein n=1 Tax=Odynerus spinipes TaxID=1348599 RepID=A0AAD9RIY9_9HYME|nr:hypothetical protein KPH14_007712 [Odynerus spinipes]